MVQTPSRQPVRQILQRHNQDCAIGAERTGSEIRLKDDHRTFGTIRPARITFQAGLVAVPGRGHDDLSASALLTGSMTPVSTAETRWDDWTICTAVAPDAVFTVRTYGTE